MKEFLVVMNNELGGPMGFWRTGKDALSVMVDFLDEEKIRVEETKPVYGLCEGDCFCVSFETEDNYNGTIWVGEPQFYHSGILGFVEMVD